jgi:cellulose synthase/poly-beta-1,6-N-acetylglucosamine synthase-like glycosyltransferase
MRFDLVQGAGVALFVFDLLVVAGLLCLPLLRENDDDKGDGGSVVLLPRPHDLGALRSFSAIASFGLLSLAYVWFGLPPVNRLYGRLLEGLTSLMIKDPALIGAYTGRADLGARFLVVGYFVALAVALRASLWRRLLMAVEILLYLLLAASIDALIIAVGIVTGWPLQPFSFEGNLVALFAGFVVMARMCFTTFALPRKVVLARTRPRYASDTLIAAAVLAFAVIVVLLNGLVAAPWLSRGEETLAPLMVAIAVWTVFFPLIYLSLLVLNKLARWTPEAVRKGPAIDVIIPAYNEEENIAGTLRAIDHAAQRYGGPVRVLLVDDGSTDRTAELASQVMAGFLAAEGVVLSGQHHGKARALNLALAETSAEIVIRTDADARLDPDALRFVPGWFADPSVGAVSGVTVPRSEASWLRKMRVLECLYEFRLARPGLQCVDAIGCVPGIFAAVRREAAVKVGGVTEGMNAEDADLTFKLGRLGYRMVLDQRIRVYEDVPHTYAGLREQRLRWARGGMHVFTRHAPFRSGGAGPRCWFVLSKMLFTRVTAPMRLFLLIYAAELVVLRPTAHHNLNTLLWAVAFTVIPMVVLRGSLLVVFRKWHLLPYIVLWYPYQFIKRLLIIESLLTLPTRPVRAPGPAWLTGWERGDRAADVPTAVAGVATSAR